MKIRITVRTTLSEVPHFSWDLIANNGVVIAKSDRAFKRYDHATRSAQALQGELFPRPNIIVSQQVGRYLKTKVAKQIAKTATKLGL